jgi:hypothetical protein
MIEEIDFPEPKTKPLTKAELAALRAEANGGRVALKDLNTVPKRNGAKPEHGPKLTLIHPDEVEIQDTHWLIKHFLPVGSLALLTGDGGTGKGTYACTLAAAITRGQMDYLNEPRMVLFCGEEDSLGRTLKPRLIAAGADMDLVRFVAMKVDGQDGSVLLPDNVPMLREAIEFTGAALSVIDPVLNHLSPKLNPHHDADVKRALTPLRRLADETSCTTLCVHHFGKDMSRGARRSAMASISFPNSARIHLVMAMDDEDENTRVLTVDKSNDGPKNINRKLRMEFVSVDGRTEPVPRIIDEGLTDKSAHDLLGLNLERGEKGKRAYEIILAELRSGAKSREHLNTAAQQGAGASSETVWRQLSKLKGEGKVKCNKDGFEGGFVWRLTAPEPEPDADIPF